jgi:hypothetical protein
MPPLIFSILVGCMLLVSGCKTVRPTDRPEPQTYKGASFEIIVPGEGVKAYVDQGDGYAVHYFNLTSSPSNMGVYEGQRPSLFSKKERDLTVMRRGTTSRGDIERGDDVWGIDSNGRIWRESVWSCQRTFRNPDGKAYKIPSMIHIWYFGVTEEEQLLFDSMIQTIEMKESVLNPVLRPS